jgi:hypothetical protein
MSWAFRRTVEPPPNHTSAALEAGDAIHPDHAPRTESLPIRELQSTALAHTRRGRCTVKVVPALSEDSTSILPRCAVTMRSAM